ncbi:MAG: LysR family transcriptional regulator [Coriobacteriales bacterium]|jgi:DNA-binding transcriptional LysR family regulator|nr:LysR family transcriptional regulator [Coriobacteriales bacterium]
MRIETLDEFVVLAKHLNFTEAAKELFVSQPSLSTHIAGLERELGFNLFVRSGSMLYLTQAGTVFLGCAQEMLSVLRKGLEESGSVATELPPVSMAGLSFDSPYYRALMRVRDQPFVFVDMIEEVTVLRALEKGIIDLGLHFDYSDIPSIRERAESHGIAFMPAGSGTLNISVMRSHPLAAKERLTREDLRGLRITITSGAHYDTWKLLVLHTLGEDLNFEFNLYQLRSMRNLAFLDLGDSAHVCGAEATACFGGRPDVVTFEEVDGKVLHYPEGFICRQSDHQARTLLDALLEQLGTG